MRTTLAALLFCSLMLTLSGCPAPAVGRDSGLAVDTGVDATGTDAGRVVTGTPTPIASVVNASAADHPMPGAGMGVPIQVTGDLVALTNRLFISQSSTNRHCLFAIWVGTRAGGDYSGIEVTDSFLPATGNDPMGVPYTCFTTPAHTIPDTIMIGDAVTTLAGNFENFCLPAGTCPPNTAQELSVTSGTFVAGPRVGDPTPTVVSISDIAGMGMTLGARDMALQGALVTITGTVMRVAPNNVMGHAMNNHGVMMVSAMGTTTPTMAISMTKYMGVSTQRTALMGSPVGTAVGSITGVLQFSFGQWIIQPRQPSDLPNVMAVAMDGGVPPG